MRLQAAVASLLAMALLGCSGGGATKPSSIPLATGPAGVKFAAQDVPLEEALALARASGRPAMLYFTAAWCGYCRMLETETLSNAQVGAHMAAYTNVRYDADRPLGQDVARRYGVIGFPTLVRLDASGAKVDVYEGYNAPQAFLARVPSP